MLPCEVLLFAGGGGVGGEGAHMLKHMGICCPNGLLFHQKNPLKWVPFWSKKTLEESPIAQKLQKKKKKKKKKKVKSAVLGAEKSSEMGLDLRKFRKKKCLISLFFFFFFSFFFEGEKSLDIGRGFRPRAAHSYSRTPQVFAPISAILYQQSSIIIFSVRPIMS